MGVDADPFPSMSVGVNAADLRSIARDRAQPYSRRRLATDDLRWVIEEARARRNQCVPSTLHHKSIFWNGGRTKVVTTADKPFVANTNIVEARFYDEDIGTIHFFGMDCYGKPSGIIACTRSALDRQTVKEVYDELLCPIAIIPFRLRKEPKIEEIP
ncbi:hypothetical protein SLEP1_g21057 [Rubroshorea leprosula]|nr:hypothetical protein SLEP1_g21057 [Rubroshorea leprosula]